MFFSKKTHDLSLTLTNLTPDSAPTHVDFVWTFFSPFFAEIIGRPQQKRLLKKTVADVDKILSDFHWYLLMKDHPHHGHAFIAHQSPVSTDHSN